MRNAPSSSGRASTTPADGRASPMSTCSPSRRGSPRRRTSASMRRHCSRRRCSRTGTTRTRSAGPSCSSPCTRSPGKPRTSTPARRPPRRRTRWSGRLPPAGPSPSHCCRSARTGGGPGSSVRPWSCSTRQRPSVRRSAIDPAGRRRWRLRRTRSPTSAGSCALPTTSIDRWEPGGPVDDRLEIDHGGRRPEPVVVGVRPVRRRGASRRDRVGARHEIRMGAAARLGVPRLRRRPLLRARPLRRGRARDPPRHRRRRDPAHDLMGRVDDGPRRCRPGTARPRASPDGRPRTWRHGWNVLPALDGRPRTRGRSLRRRRRGRRHPPFEEYIGANG